jgi:protoheme IX farnesyltransferase
VRSCAAGPPGAALDTVRGEVVEEATRGALQRVARAHHVLVELTKLRLVSLVLVTGGVGFIMAGGGVDDWSTLVWTLLGTGLTAAGAMALNEVIERHRDGRMVRTRNRPIPSGEIAPAQATVLGVGVSLAGVAVLAARANLLTAGLGAAVVLLYTLVYTPLKVRTTLCTLVGAVCGAIPPIMGWTAAAGSVGFGAWLLAAVLFLWQIPHFLSLAWLHRDDYVRGGFRVLPVIDSHGRATVALTNLYILALVPIGLAATLAGLTGWPAAFGGIILGVSLLAAGLHLARTRSHRSARRLFFATLAYLPLLLTLLVVARQPVVGLPNGPAASHAQTANVSRGITVSSVQGSPLSTTP